LASRGFTLPTIERMKLGWADGNLTKSIKRANLDGLGLSIDDFAAASLICESQSKPGSHYDWFDVRVIFPLLHRGKVLNLSGRQTHFSTKPEKYRHLRGIEVRNLYNEEAIGSRVWVFEGHPDTLAGLEIGLPAVGVVGTSGMQCPEKFARAQEIFICPDNDEPGRKAVEKWAQAIMKHNTTAKIYFVMLPDGIKDFNEWMLEYKGAGLQEAFDKLQAGAQGVIEYKINQLKTVEDLEGLWPLLAPLNDIAREGFFRQIKTKMPACGLPTLRKTFKLWQLEEDKKAAVAAKILEISFKDREIKYFNVDFTFNSPATAHVCLYGDVKRIENGEEAISSEPVLIKSTINPEKEGYNPEQVVLSDAIVSAAALRSLPSRSIVRGRWSHESIANFLSGDAKTPNTGELAKRIADFFRRYIWFQNPANYEVLAFYAMGTYVARLFEGYPYLAVNGLKRTGKSNTLDLMKNLCFNAVDSVNSSVAATFRLIESSFPTWIRDEAEQFNTKTPENMDELTILNAGYKAGNMVTRVEKTGNGAMEIQEFNVFSPKIFGGIAILNPTLLDRAILIKSHRAPKEIVKNMPRMNQTRKQWQAEAAKIRDELYIWMLTKFHYVKDIFENYPPSDAIINREWEVWLPLLSLAYLADAEIEAAPDDNFTNRMITFAVEKGQEKQESEQEDVIEHKILETIASLQEEGTLYNIPGYGYWYPINPLAKKLTEAFKEEGYYKDTWHITARRLIRVLEQTRAVSNRAEQVRQIWFGGKNQKCVHLPKEAISEAILSL
jgi:hypothetical protein